MKRKVLKLFILIIIIIIIALILLVVLSNKVMPLYMSYAKEEMKINGYIGSMRDETEEYKTEKVAYKVPYTETYCTGCGKIK